MQSLVKTGVDGSARDDMNDTAVYSKEFGIPVAPMPEPYLGLWDLHAIYCLPSIARLFQEQCSRLCSHERNGRRLRNYAHLLFIYLAGTRCPSSEHTKNIDSILGEYDRHGLVVMYRSLLSPYGTLRG